MKKPKTNDTRRHCMVVYAPYPLGETRVQREAESLVRAGFEVDVICLRDSGDLPEDRYKGVHIYREPYVFPLRLAKKRSLGERFLNYLWFLITSCIRLTRLHFKRRYRTVQVHNLPDFLVFCAAVPWLMGVPVILDLHDLMPEFYTGRFGEGESWPARFIRLQERWACQFASHVITVSEHWREALIRRGVPGRKCSVVMNVADESIFYPVEQRPDQEESRDSFRLVYHGAVVERYGLDLVVQAVDKVRHRIPSIHLTLVGRGEYLPQVVLLVERLGLRQYVSIEDLHLAEELPQIIRSCDLGVVPYRNDVFTDGLLPTKLMEYAALGLPAVASRTTAIETYFSNANVEFFEPGDVNDLARCLRELYLHPKRLAQLARSSQNFNQKYNWVKFGEEYVHLIEGLGNRRAPGAKAAHLNSQNE